MRDDPIIYVIEDDAQMRDALQLLLTTAGLSVRAFVSAEAFLALTADNQPLCIVLDVRLPGMSGLKLLEELGKSRRRSAVVVITGHGDVPMAVSAMRAGAFHFIEKPFDPQMLLDSVDEALHLVKVLEEERGAVAEFEASLQTLTPREEEVMALLVAGLPTKLIATRLEISTRTAEHHRAAVMKKMNARTLSHLIRMALKVHAGTSYR
jgi:two-component system response regulator FixJ